MGDGLTNDEVEIIANIGQTLRQKSKIKAEILSKCLYGGENSAKIKEDLTKIVVGSIFVVSIGFIIDTINKIVIG